MFPVGTEKQAENTNKTKKTTSMFLLYFPLGNSDVCVAINKFSVY